MTDRQASRAMLSGKAARRSGLCKNLLSSTRFLSNRAQLAQSDLALSVLLH
jgi:hypothetical protein